MSNRGLHLAKTITLWLLGGMLLWGCSNSSPVQVAATYTPDPPAGIELVATPTVNTEALGTGSNPIIATPTDKPTPAFQTLSVSATSCNYGGEFLRIEALDEFTVRFTLCAPDPAFLVKLAFPVFGIQPKEWLEQTGGGGKDNPLLEHPIGTGPYQFGEWVRGEKLVLRAFEGYWGERARMPNLVFLWNRDPAQRLLELQIGTIDGIDNVGLDDLAEVEADTSLQRIYRAPLSVFYIGINNTTPPLDDEKVRQAIALGLDRQKIVNETMPPGYQIASHFTPCIIPYGCEGEAWYEYDPLVAKQLLAEAGYPDGFSTQLTYRDAVRGYLPRPDLVAQEIRTQLKTNLNISVKVVPMDTESLYAALETGELQGLYLLGWGADYPEVTNFLDVHFGANASRQFGNKFADIVEGLSKASMLMDSPARQALYAMVNEAIRQHVPMIPVAHGGWYSPNTIAVAFRSEVQGAYASPLGWEDFSQMSVPYRDTFLWMQGEEPLSLYCADQTDTDSLRTFAQIMETLYRFEPGTLRLQPALAERCEPNHDLTIWTCTLRRGIRFHDGSLLDANDVVMTLWVQWDGNHPLHKGNSGAFAYWVHFWGAFLPTSAK